MFTKHFARIICRTELDREDVEDFFDVVEGVVSTKLITAYDEDKEEVGIDVISYTDEDKVGQLYIYEVILSEEIDSDEGDEISEQLFEFFNDIKFTFEASIEI